jgi:hypothetical protein
VTVPVDKGGPRKRRVQHAQASTRPPPRETIRRRLIVAGMAGGRGNCSEAMDEGVSRGVGGFSIKHNVWRQQSLKAHGNAVMRQVAVEIIGGQVQLRL